MCLKASGSKLTIVGREIDSYYAIRQKNRPGSQLVDAVRFLGYVGPAELNTLYETCHIFVFPSTVETFGNPLLEAMSFGMPIACSDTAAMPEVIGDAGLTFNPRDTEDIARKIETLLSDEALRAALGEEASAGRWIFAGTYRRENCQVLRSAVPRSPAPAAMSRSVLITTLPPYQGASRQ